MDINAKFQIAIKYYQTQKLKEAESIFKQILKFQPKNANALHFLGLIYYHRKEYRSAIEYIEKAIHYAPHYYDAYDNLGTVLKEAGELDKSISCYQKALKINPISANTHYNMGIALQANSRIDEAIESYQNALKINPDFAQAHYNLGNIFKEKNQLDEAMIRYQKTITLNPLFAEAYNNLGTIFHRKGLFNQAIEYYQRALNINPLFTEAHNNLGTVLYKNGQIDEAIESYQNALKINPDFAQAHYNLGNIFKEKNQLDEAMIRYQKTITLNPLFAEAYNNLGTIFHRKGLFNQAIEYYQKAIDTKTNNDDAYYNLGNVFHQKEEFDKAIACYEKALEINPNNASIYNNLANVLRDLGNLTKAEEYYRKAILINPQCSIFYSNLLFLMNYVADYSGKTIFLEHLQFAKEYEKPTISPYNHITNGRKKQRTKIGYISPDFRNHSVAFFIEAVFAHHNKKDYEIFCYSDVSSPDVITNRIRAHADVWKSIIGLSDEEAAEIIYKDNIDILVDLAGHTANNRLLLFIRKPVPIQVSWLGYPATTGLSSIDYKIVDNYTDPPGMTEHFYTEKLIRMPESFLCYSPDKNSPEVSNLPFLSNKYITFGSFNNFSKVSCQAFALWIEILKAVTDSHLILKAKGLADKKTCQQTMDIFSREGIDEARIELQSSKLTLQHHLETYGKVDIGLDTFPYNGTTTTCEALWMGAPVITLEGNTHVSRLGVSLLSNVGLPELVAKTSDEYISIAVNLSKDLKRLHSLRLQLRNMMGLSPLCDAKRFTANLELCYKHIWRNWCKSI